jgi:hypothetical protein
MQASCHHMSRLLLGFGWHLVASAVARSLSDCARGSLGRRPRPVGAPAAAVEAMSVRTRPDRGGPAARRSAGTQALRSTIAVARGLRAAHPRRRGDRACAYQPFR